MAIKVQRKKRVLEKYIKQRKFVWNMPEQVQEAGDFISNNNTVTDFLQTFPQEQEAIQKEIGQFLENLDLMFYKYGLKKSRDAKSVIDDQINVFLQDLGKRIEKYKATMELIGPVERFLVPIWSSLYGKLEKSRFNQLDLFSKLIGKQPLIKEIIKLLGRLNKEQERAELSDLESLKPNRANVYSHFIKTELVGITESDDIANVIITEISFLTSEKTEFLFYKRLLEKKLLTFQFYGKNVDSAHRNLKTRKIKGPIILAIDASGSMVQGEREKYAKTIGLCVLKSAIKQKRDVHIILFSNDIIEYTVKPKKEILPTVIDFLGNSFHGGTNAEAALNSGIKKMESDQFCNADMLFITDGAVPELKDTCALNKVRKRGNKFYALLLANNSCPFGSQLDKVWHFDIENLHETYSRIKKIS